MPPPRKADVARVCGVLENLELGGNELVSLYRHPVLDTGSQSLSKGDDVAIADRASLVRNDETPLVPKYLSALVPSKRAAFTLAEVLITLGIIGVVAALTIPSVMAKYKHKELETRFKKSYSLVSQATADLAIEYNACNVEDANEIREHIFSKLKKIKNATIETQTNTLNYSFKTYNMNDTNAQIHPNCLGLGHKANYIITPDGAVISFCTNATMGNLISIDTNGFKKKPNAYGHDLFFFIIGESNCKLTPLSYQWRNCIEGEEGCTYGDGNWGEYGWKHTSGVCSRISEASENGFVCTPYAVKNVCPDDETKNYWDCLP